jgi:xanthine dehydrogenase accessory factor
VSTERQIVEAALALLHSGQDFAWLTVVDTQGSSPRHAGAEMLVRADGSIMSTIGGGPLEAQAIRTAIKVLGTRQSEVMRFDLSGREPGLGMICGGKGLVLVDYVSAADPVALDLCLGLLDLFASRRKGWLVTRIPEEGGDGWAAGKCLVDQNGVVAGTAACSNEVLEQLTAKGGVHADAVAGADLSRLYVRPIAPAEKLYIFGCGHCGQKLAAVAEIAGFSTVVVDDRTEFANAERFPGADRIVVPPSFDVAFDGLPIDEDSYVVIMTRGHSHDRTVLALALRTPAGYIGMIGSKKKVTETFHALQSEGFRADDISRVHAPIGLQIGSETPEEIAVSIVAQLIQVRASRRR